MKPGSTTKLDYELELRNLSILKLIKHPCIIQLLTCFTFQDKHSFILSLADGGSLAEVFSGKRHSPFKTEDELLVALCGLSSAIRTIHTFKVDGFETIGCHHDLKPSNVLVRGKSLLLSDFGLSRFKDVKEDSRSYFRGGRGDYLAPECEDLGDNFKKHQIRRSSDVWSFGCILTELLTLFFKGAEGVARFRSLRTFARDGINYYRFHRGLEVPNSSVWSWISDLKEGPDGSLVSEMEPLLLMSLECQPEKRSSMSMLDQRLRFIAVGRIATQISVSFSSLVKSNQSLLARIEMTRFQSWKWAMEPSAAGVHSHEESFLSNESFGEFEAVLAIFKELNQTLLDIQISPPMPRERKFLPIRRLNDVLYDLLPRCCQDISKMRLECWLLESQNQLESNKLDLMSQDREISSHLKQLSAIQHLKTLVESNKEAGGNELVLDSSDITRTAWLQDFYIGKLTGEDHSSSDKSVIVETKIYDDHYAIESVAMELFNRLKAICRLLNSSAPLRVLPCCGYYHDPESYSLAIVYSFPERNTGNTILQAGSLHSILQADFQGQYRPLLGNRFQLAHVLATSILEFHKVNWVQKAISALNIIFFRPSGSSWKYHMDSPYFMGFLRSRQNDEFSFTEGPPEDKLHIKYQHPSYQEDGNRFQPHYDYYSLGIVLLELGLWRTIDAITNHSSFQGTTKEQANALCRLAVPRLGQTMGATYQRVVEDCMYWEPKACEKAGDNCSAAICLRFFETIVQPLASCRA
jgi:Protein kinase domain